MDYKEILEKASNHLYSLKDTIIPVLEISKPNDVDYARHLAKVISKLSPLVGNMVEYNVCLELNKLDWLDLGKWKRQDPGFPDTIFESNMIPTPGIEIKTWFPLATEITARFKDTTTFFNQDQTNVAVVAWLPEFIIYGKPKILDVWVGEAKKLANSRDTHYHNPPDYLVFEPEDTSQRTSNLQQTNTNGYKFQGNKNELNEAQKIVDSWGSDGKLYNHSKEYQQKLRQLLGAYAYRLDTNFAKIDRIQYKPLEDFKKKVLDMELHQHSIKEWTKIVNNPSATFTELLNNLT